MLKLRTKEVEQIDHSATGKEARSYRKSCAKSLRSAAQNMGVSAAYLSDLELGRRNWSENLLRRFERAIK